MWTDLLPRLAERDALGEGVVVAIGADHAELDRVLGELGDAFGVLALGLGDERIWTGRARRLATELALVLTGVVDREQCQLDPLVDQVLRRDEREEHVRAHRRRLVADPFGVAWLRDTLGEVGGLDQRIFGLLERTRRRAYRRAAAVLSPAA